MAHRYKPSRLDEVTVARAVRLLKQGVPKAQVIAELDISEGSVERIARGSHPLLRRLVRGRPAKNRCPGCGGLKLRSDQPCQVCPLRKKRKPQRGAA